MGATTDDVIGFDFEVDEKAILDRLLESTSVVSTKFEKALVDKLNKAFENAGRKSGKAVQLGGVYQKLFDDFASASGDVDLLSKAIDNFAGRISYLDKISNKAKSQGIEGILDSLTVGDINKILKNYDSIIEKQEKINEISSDINRKKITDKIERDIAGIDQLIGKYGSKGIDEYNKKLNDFLTEKFNKNPNLTPTIDTKKAADEYASLLTTFENLSKNGAKQGTEQYVKQQMELLSVMKQIQLFEQKNDLFKGFRTTQKDALPLLVKSINELEIQGVKGSVSRLISELTKELKSQISEMYDNVVEITANYGKKRVEKQAATYEDIVKFLELNTSKKVKVGKANPVPDNDKLDGINKFLVSIEEAEKKIYELASRSSVTDTKIDSRNIDDVMELIGYLQRFQDLGGNIESLNLNRTIIRRFNGKGLEPNVISEENKNAILNLRKEISKAITAGVQDSINETKKELSDSTESKSGLSNGSVNGISDESAKLLTDRLDLIKQEIINSKEISKQEINNLVEKIDETNNLIKDGIQSNLSTISQNVQTIGTTISGMNLQNNNVISATYKSIADILIDMSKADAIMKDNNIQLHERGFFFNSKTKQHTNEFIYGEEHGIPIKLLKDAIENLVVDSMMHKHTGKYAAMSLAEKEGAGDLFTFKKLKDQGINNQIIAAQDNVQIFDAKKFYDKYGEFFENVTDEVISSLHNQIYKEMHNIATEPTRESDLLEAISQVRIPFETFINNIDAITPEIKDILNSDEFQKRFINALKNSEDGMYAAIDSFLENEGINGQIDFGDNFSNWISDTENGMILVAQKAQENILKKYLNDDSFSLSDYTKTLSLDDYKKQFEGDINVFETIVNILNQINESLSSIDLKNTINEVDSLKESVIELSSAVDELKNKDKTVGTEDKNPVSSVKNFYDNYGFPSEALDKSHFANVDEVLNKLGGRFKEMNSEAKDFSEMKLNGEFFKELLTQLSLTEDQLTVIKAALIEIDNYVPGGKFRHLSGDKVSNAFVQRQIETINNIIKGNKAITDDDLSTARDILHYANGGFNSQPQDQSSPNIINVKPILNPQEFADEVTEQLKGFYTNIDVRAKVEDENLFVTEVTQSLNGWNANIAVQPEIDTPSNFADSVSEQIRFSPAQIPVEPLSEGEFDSERFAQQVTNRLIGESAKINVDLNGSDNQNGQPNINIETENLNGLNETLDDITRRIGQKTSAFANEQGVVEKVVNVEKAKLTDLKDAVDGVTKSVNDKTKAFNDEAKAVNAAIQAEKKQQEESEKRQQKSTKKNLDEYDEEYVKILNSAYADADENLKREAEEQAIINKLKAEGIKQEQEFSKHQKQNRDELKKYSDELLKLSDESNASKYPTIYKDALAKIKNEVEQVESLNIVSDKDLENIKGLVDNLKQTEKLANKAKVSSLIAEIQKYLEKNTKLPTQTRKELKGLIDELNRLDIVKSDVQDVVSKFKDLDAEMIQAGKTGKGLLQAIGEKAFYRTAQYIATFFSFQDLVRYARTAVSTIRELDTELVDLQKTAKMSSSELNRFYLSSNDVAKQMGVTTKEIINQASAWSRLNKIGLLYGNI